MSFGLKRKTGGLLLVAVFLFTALCALFVGGLPVSAASGYTVTVCRDGNADSPYLPENRDWQAIASVEVTGGRIWAAWMAGGTKEPDPDNHIIVAYSNDEGITWRDPFIIIDDNGNQSTRLRDPVLWQDDAGALWLFFGYSGTHAVVIANPEASVSAIKVSEPQPCFSQTILNKPIIRSNGEWLVAVDPYLESADYSVTHILSSADRGATWQQKGQILSHTANKRYHEATMVEKEDGTLWCISRIEQGTGGGLEQAFSSDGGTTWTDYEANLSEPFRGPGSKCAMRRLSSGNLLFVNNDSTSGRVNMTAYLSEDDGETWSELLLDSRNGCAYPDIAEGDSGEIYVIWDFGRSVQNEIRVSRFLESDVKQGAFVSAWSKNMIAVAKDGAYSDIVGGEEELPRAVSYPLGADVTTESFAASLPSTLHVVTDKGAEYVLTGNWVTNWFSADYEGNYIFRFEWDRGILPENVADNTRLLEVVVTVASEEESPGAGCASSAGTGAAWLGAAALLPALCCMRKKRI